MCQRQESKPREESPHRGGKALAQWDALREIPQADWRIANATFVLYHLFPNIQFIVNEQTATLIRIYPDTDHPGRSVTRISFYYTPEVIQAVEAEQAEGIEISDVYDYDGRQGLIGGIEASLEVFHSTIEQEDYRMGEMQQRAAETGLLKEIIFGRNEPALHHFHQNYRAALGQPPLEPVN